MISRSARLALGHLAELFTDLLIELALFITALLPIKPPLLMEERLVDNLFERSAGGVVRVGENPVEHSTDDFRTDLRSIRFSNHAALLAFSRPLARHGYSN